MESSPSYENYGKDTGSESKSSESPKAIRIPLPASEVHASEPQRPERLIPLFQKFGEKDKEAEAEENEKKSKEETPDAYRVEAEKPKEPDAGEKTETAAEIPAADVATEHTGPHRDLAGLEHDLWDEFDNTPPATEQESTVQGGGTATLERPEQAERQAESEIDMPEAEAEAYDETENDKQFFEIANTVDPTGEFRAGEKELAENDTKNQPEHVLWDESHTLHINTPPTPKVEAPPAPIIAAAPELMPAPAAEHGEDTISAAPSVEAMAAEVAATEPDDDPSSAESLNRLYNAPAAEVSEDHPEAYGEPLPPMSDDEKFHDIMAGADMAPDFVRATSEGPITPPTEMAEEPVDDIPPVAPIAPPTVRPLGTFRGGDSGVDGPGPMPVPVSETRPSDSADDDPYGLKWYPPRTRYGRSMAGGAASVAGRAVEAAAITGMMAGGHAAHAAEAAAAGGIVGGIAGGVAGYEAGKHAARRETNELKQTVEQQDQHITTLTNEQRVTHEQVDQLTRTNQTLTEQQRTMGQQAEQQTAEAARKESAEAAAIAAAVAAERVQSHSPDEKVVRSEWVDMVVDKRTGKLVEREDVNNFGAELEAEQRHNTAPPDPLADALAAAKAAAQASADVGTYDQSEAQLQGAINPMMMGSGQADISHELPAGYGDGGMVDPNHRLAGSRNPVMTAVSSPLLWVGVIVLILAFLAAAFL
jgi:hypothetical protein